jgi:phospholipase/carboxylesterase
MLDYNFSLPADPADGAPVIVLLHGRGSNKSDLMGLRPGLPPEAIVVTPQAPFSGAQWGYGGGWAWYKYLGGTTPDPDTFLSGQAQLEEFFANLPQILPVKPGPIVIGGFSQGATSSLAYALRHPGTVAGVLVFSGFLADHPSVAATPETVAGTRFFWGHGHGDPMISHATGEQGRAALRAAGADLTTGDYPIGHSIDPGELHDASTWLSELFAGVSVR